MIGGHKVVSDCEREGERAAGLDLVLAVADRTEQLSQVVHTPAVNAPQPFGDGRVTPGPGADCQVDRQQVAGEGKRAGQTYLDPRVTTVPFGAFAALALSRRSARKGRRRRLS